jgi:rRNA maturation RNase YbeY
LGYDDKELSVLFTDDDHIADLNSHYLDRTGPTNVLAFPMQDDKNGVSGLLGDIVVSLETALREADEFNEKPEITVRRLLIHGLLHLIGYDHETSDSEAELMEREERRLFNLLEEDGTQNGTVSC